MARSKGVARATRASASPRARMRVRFRREWSEEESAKRHGDRGAPPKRARIDVKTFVYARMTNNVVTSVPDVILEEEKFEHHGEDEVRGADEGDERHGERVPTSLARHRALTNVAR